MKGERRKAKKVVLSSFAMAAHLGSPPLHPLDGGEGRDGAEMAPSTEKIVYSAAGMVVKEGVDDHTLGADAIEDDEHDPVIDPEPHNSFIDSKIVSKYNIPAFQSINTTATLN